MPLVTGTDIYQKHYLLTKGNFPNSSSVNYPMLLEFPNKTINRKCGIPK